MITAPRIWISPNSDDRGIGFIRRLTRDRAANDVAKFETVHCLQQICGREPRLLLYRFGSWLLSPPIPEAERLLAAWKKSAVVWLHIRSPEYPFGDAVCDLTAGYYEPFPSSSRVHAHERSAFTHEFERLGFGQVLHRRGLRKKAGIS